MSLVMIQCSFWQSLAVMQFFLHSFFIMFTPAHTKHLSFRTILHFSSIHFLIVAHSTFSLAENFSSVHSFTTAILFGSSFRSFLPFPSTLPVFASIIPAKYKFEKFQGKSFWGVFWELFHLFLKDVHLPARGPNKHCGLLVGLHLITRLLQLVSRQCTLLWS